MARPAAGYVMTATGMNGQKFVMTNNLSGTSCTTPPRASGTTTRSVPSNEIDVSTMQVAKQ